MYPRSQILFPHSCVRGLRNLLDERWKALVNEVLAQGEASDAGLAFSLMMIRLCGCLQCDMSSYKATLGCDVCSQRAVLGLREGSKGLLRRYERALQELRENRSSLCPAGEDDQGEGVAAPASESRPSAL